MPQGKALVLSDKLISSMMPVLIARFRLATSLTGRKVPKRTTPGIVLHSVSGFLCAALEVSIAWILEALQSVNFPTRRFNNPASYAVGFLALSRDSDRRNLLVRSQYVAECSRFATRKTTDPAEGCGKSIEWSTFHERPAWP